MPPVYPLQGDTSSCYLHPQVGSVLLAAADLLGLALPRDNDSVAARTAGAGGCPVGVGVDFRFRQGRRPPAYLLSAHPFIPVCPRSLGSPAAGRSGAAARPRALHAEGRDPPSPGCP